MCFLQANNIEWAISFSAEKFSTTFSSIRKNTISSANVLVFYYTDTPEFDLSSGILAKKDFCGVPLTLRHPHDTTQNDHEVFTDTANTSCAADARRRGEFPGFAVIALSLPPSLLTPLHGYEDDGQLCVLLVDSMDAMRPCSFQSIVNFKPWLAGYSLLSPACFVRCFRLVEKEAKEVSLDPSIHITDSLLSSSDSKQSLDSETPQDQPTRVSGVRTSNPLSSLSKSFRTMLSTSESQRSERAHSDLAVHIVPVHEISTYLSRMAEIRLKAKSLSVAPLYHYTSMAVAPMIMKGGLRMSTQGQGDGGVYFSTKGPCKTVFTLLLVLLCFLTLLSIHTHFYLKHPSFPPTPTP